MIYFDNAATTYPKPDIVKRSMMLAMKKYGANPGRSGHKMSMKAAKEVYDCRKACAKFFNASGPECVVFTLNCTHATNIVLKGILKPGDHVVISCLEHNAVTRPINTLELKGVTCTKATVYPYDNDKTVDAFRHAFTEKTRLVVCMHASNVLGIRLPIERICALAHQYNILTMIDAAQTAGVLNIDMKDFGIDYLCTSGHKSLYGPMGTGLLVTEKGSQLSSLIEGGTGTDSLSPLQPSGMPEHLESGTPNMQGIVGLHAGLKFVSQMTFNRIFDHEFKLILRAYDGLSKMPHVILYTQRPEKEYSVPLLSFNVKGMHSEEVASFLNSNGCFTRAGFHCSGLAHQFLGTLKSGTVRIAPSVFSKEDEVEFFLRLVSALGK